MAELVLTVGFQRLIEIIEQQSRRVVKLVVGVEGEVNDLKNSLRDITAVLADAEKKQVQNDLVRNWLEDLKVISYELDNVLDEWSSLDIKRKINRSENALCSSHIAPCFSCFTVDERYGIGVRIRSINTRLRNIAESKNQYNFLISNDRLPGWQRPTSVSIVDVSEIHGRDEDKKEIVSKLLSEGSRAKPGLHIISIWGLGGIGKTTLAQLAYNEHSVMAYFERRIWVCVSDPFDLVKISRAILEGLRVDASNLHELETLQQKIQKSLSGQRFLIVLDDVWTEQFEIWEKLVTCLKCGARGSRILVTTRNEAVAKTIGTTELYPLKLLSEEECWSLFKKLAFSERSEESIQELEEIGRKIAHKCKGLPLGAKTLGSLMRLKNNIQDWVDILNNELWQLEVIEKQISPALLLSYYDLSPPVQRCFSYCAVFPKDHIFERDYLIKLWMSQNYLGFEADVGMESTGRRYFEDLAMRSFFQDFVTDGQGNILSFKMHDIVHDFAQFLTNKECSLVEVRQDMGIESFLKMNYHSTLIRLEKTPFPEETPFPRSTRMENLRTLLAQSLEIGKALPNLLQRVKYVRALDLSENSIDELPNEIGGLVHLRFLNLSGNDTLDQLPETVCNLCNLQTLKLSLCHNLEALPHGMGKLINLRHLEIDETRIESLPKGIGSLESLQTLTKFIVSGGGHCRACRLRDLKILNKLCGRLQIDELGNTADRDEAEKAALENKTHLVDLELNFSGRRRELDAMKDVAEALQPHKDLKSLSIRDYNNTEFPSWISTSLTRLTTLSLNKAKCTCLPPLGRLRLLESLEIQNMSRLKCLGAGFLRMEGDSSSTVAFPRLKKLGFSVMNRWNKWQVKDDEEEDISDAKMMPVLCSLTINECPNLDALPNQVLRKATLKELSIRSSRVLRRRYRIPTGESAEPRVDISHIPRIQIDDESFERNTGNN